MSVDKDLTVYPVFFIFKRNSGDVNETPQCQAAAHRMSARPMGDAPNKHTHIVGLRFMIDLMPDPQSLAIADLRSSYLAGRDTPAAVVQRLLDRAAGADPHHVWITRLSPDQVMTHVAALDASAIMRLPLYGIPFVIKDNIDLAGVATTAGCPDFAYTPAQSAFVVERLLEAGAIPLGKTNLDQFATGLVGTRSPYGACRNSFNPDFISGGSSSGLPVLDAARRIIAAGEKNVVPKRANGDDVIGLTALSMNLGDSIMANLMGSADDSEYNARLAKQDAERAAGNPATN